MSLDTQSSPPLLLFLSLRGGCLCENLRTRILSFSLYVRYERAYIYSLGRIYECVCMYVYVCTTASRPPMYEGVQGFDGFRPSYVHGVEESRAEVVVNKLEMNGTDSVRVEWKTKAQADVGGSIIVNFKTDVSLNLISGRITKMRLTWDTNGSDGLAAIGFNLRRRADSVSLRATRTAEWLQSIVDGDGDQNQPGNLSVDPRDPNKFFQQDDTNFQDAVFFCIGITLMYILVKALVILNS